MEDNQEDSDEVAWVWLVIVRKAGESAEGYLAIVDTEAEANDIMDKYQSSHPDDLVWLETKPEV